ncbi:MAG: rhodanese-related sulfurtransferase [Xanthomonadales bacterium]|nr:rhodanese-related sulfurtransferase [Gammaproteobacteria bacterium]MBT8074279.1 rhodanese-related sulfurtransferase [Gammaproteobacteria bacterium]NNK05131.1 rhodanese-related sulfurtransferase [Xanthomonadales bacterium]NNK98277.1 rhodanese-related sulfurtransferase [Xanthomonadales bacterium]
MPGKSSNQTRDGQTQVAAFYKFTDLDDLKSLQRDIREVCEESGLLGTVLLAREGINGTVAGPGNSIRNLFDHLRSYPQFADLGNKLSCCERNPFYRMKVRLKKEIVTLGVEGIDPVHQAGEYVAPEKWNDLISQPGVRLVDTRNNYEFELGTFDGAENPRTTSFREFPDWVEANLGDDREQPVAMFCTGGIRCEKSTSLLRKMGYKRVYHLEGGILNYLEKIPAGESKWQGDCFVFDNRVSVDHDLAEGRYELCPACRMPLSGEDLQSTKFERNVSCPRCFDRLTPQRRASLEERARQIELAAARGEKHIGS